ncbi:MAG: response regulator, partial [Chloroflexi bacterium]|nr:response regulator [Chloroflexota bacterium]
MPKSDLVLLALDDEQSLQLFDRALTAVSYHVAFARDRAALNKALQESSPALVIIGQNFNEANELEIAAGILERFPTLPVLLLLLKDSPEIVKKAINIGVSDCLYAPLHIDEIMKTVENSIKRADRIGDWTRREVKRTTASLQQRVDELQKLDTIIEHIEDGVIILAEQSHLLLINPAARRAFGLWQDDAVRGKPVNEVLPHTDLKILLDQG